MGVEGHRRAGPDRVSVGLLTVSDTREEATDVSGRLARGLLEAAGHRVFAYRILPDDPSQVRDQLERWLAEEDCQAVVVNGGTGISERDRTYEAVSALFEKTLDGFGELFRWLSYQRIGPAAMLSRAAAGIARGRPIFSVPGSPEAVRLALEELILPELGHLVGELRKGRPSRSRLS